MLGQPYYHGVIRRITIAIGELFSDMKIERINNNKTVQLIPVPITYGPKEKWLRRITENPDLQKGERITVPRMSFEITDYQYDQERKVMNNKKLVGGAYKVFSPVPYNLSVSLYVLTRTQEDAFNILEQILPYFTPAMELTTKIVDEPCIISTFPLVLEGIDLVDNWDTDLDDQRMIINTLKFVAKINLYGPTADPASNIIKKTITTIGQNTDEKEADVVTSTVEPITASKNDTYTIIDEWTKT